MSKKSETKEILEIVSGIARDYENILKILRDVNTRTESILAQVETIHKLLLSKPPSELEDKVSEINDKVSYAIEQIGRLKKMMYYHRRFTEKRGYGYNPRYPRRYNKRGDSSDSSS